MTYEQREPAFDATKPYQTRDGRKAYIAYQNYPGGDYGGATQNIGALFWDHRGWHKGGDRNLDLVNVAPTPAPEPAAEDDGAIARALDAMDWSGISIGHKTVITAARDALARRAVATNAEPVGWRCQTTRIDAALKDTVLWQSERPNVPSWYTLIPLYATPTPAPSHAGEDGGTVWQKPARDVLVWLDGALACKAWKWDADQHACAKECADELRKLLPPAPNQEG